MGITIFSGCKFRGPGLRQSIPVWTDAGELSSPAPAANEDALDHYRSANSLDTVIGDDPFLTPEDLAFEIPPAPQSFVGQESDFQPIGLTGAIRTGIGNSKIIRDLGGNVLRSPQSSSSIFDPAITYADPQLGEEAALSEFDARFFSQIFFEKNDRVVNNQFLATDGVLSQDLGEIRTGVSKRAVNGGQFTLSTIQEYDFNNSIGNRFGNPSHSWSNLVQGEFRQPLLRGSQALVNRITGPNVNDGVFNGVLVAKTRTDISATQFKSAVRNYIADVENAYWDLYFAYRDFEAKKSARDNALESWRRIKALGNEKKAGGEADKEGQAREQYYRFEAEVNDALYGRVNDATRSNNGSAGGTFRPSPGVRVAERRLRLLIGMPANDSYLLRPSEEPGLAPVAFDWNNSVTSAFTTRAEVVGQLQRIKQVRMEMFATRANRKPQLDVLGRYTVRGFGENLIGESELEPTPSAIGDTFDNENHEWQLGVDLNIPIGYRRANTSLRNAEHRLARERQVLVEQKRQIVNDLSDAFLDVERAWKSYDLQYNRLNSALAQFAAVKETNLRKKAPFNLVLEAQRRVLDAQVQFYRAQVEYTLAVRNVHFEKGTLFDYIGVYFSGANLTDAYAGFSSETILSEEPVAVPQEVAPGIPDIPFESVLLSPDEATESFGADGSTVPPTTDPGTNPLPVENVLPPPSEPSSPQSIDTNPAPQSPGFPGELPVLEQPDSGPTVINFSDMDR